MLAFQPCQTHVTVQIRFTELQFVDLHLTAFCAAWREEDVEVVLAVFPPLELVEYPIGERAEALGASVGEQM